MARLLNGNLITAPSNMNKNYWDDYISANDREWDYIQKAADTFGNGLVGAANAYESESRSDAAEERANEELGMQKTKFEQEQSDRNDAIAAKAKRAKQVDEFYKGAHDAVYDTIEGKAAAQSYIDGDTDALNKFRANLELQKEKEDAKATADKEKAADLSAVELKKEVARIDLPMTPNEWKNLGENAEPLRQKLKELKARAIELGDFSTQQAIDSSLKEISLGEEKAQGEAVTAGKVAGQKAQDAATAAKFGGKKK